jgi:hypothetical protein
VSVDEASRRQAQENVGPRAPGEGSTIADHRDAPASSPEHSRHGINRLPVSITRVLRTGWIGACGKREAVYQTARSRNGKDPRRLMPLMATLTGGACSRRLSASFFGAHAVRSCSFRTSTRVVIEKLYNTPKKLLEQVEIIGRMGLQR